MNVEKIMQDLEKKHPGEAEYLQAVRRSRRHQGRDLSNILSLRKPR